MTLNTFFKEMRKLRGRFELDKYGRGIRTKREHRVGNKNKYRCLCPIEELYRVRAKKRYNGSLDTAENALGLYEKDACEIIDAADTKWARYRADLLRSLGLQELNG